MYYKLISSLLCIIISRVLLLYRTVNTRLMSYCWFAEKVKIYLGPVAINLDRVRRLDFITSGGVSIKKPRQAKL